MDNNFLLLSFTFIFVLSIAFLFRFTLLLLLFFGEETQGLNVLIKTNFAGVELNEILRVSFAIFLIFFGFDKCQFFLFDPFSIDICFFSNLLFKGVIDLNTLVLVVLFKSGSLRLFYLLLNGLLSLNWNRFCLNFFRSLLDVFFGLEFILNVSNVSPSSAFFSLLIAMLKKNYTLPVPLLRSR